MKKQVFSVTTSIAIACGSIVASAATIDPQTPADALPASESSGWSLEFTDEFNDSSLDLTKWQMDESTKTRSPRWDRGIADWWFSPANVSTDGVGNLVLSVTKEDANTMHTGSISSKNLYEPTYGYFEARIEIADSTKDTHTAFWLQGQNQKNVDGTGNDGAEVDIFESAWFTDTTKGVVHIDGYGADHRANTKPYNTPGIHNGYHTFGIEWNEHVMNIYYDGVLKTQYEGKWVPQVAEFLWLSDGASFGDIGTFSSEPVGLLTSAKFDYVRTWQAVPVDDLVLVGGDKMNGNFNSEAGSAITFKNTPGWFNLGGADNINATKNNVAFDGSQNLLATSARIAALNTGYAMIEGDTFDISYVWQDAWNWVDASDKISVSLFITSDDTLGGTRTDLIENFSPLAAQNGAYETVDHDSIYTATAADAGKVIFVAIQGDSTGYARVDNFELIKHSAYSGPNINAPVFTVSPINKTNATVDAAYSGTIGGSATDADGDQLTYSLISSPTWLTIASDGTLWGTPTQAGSDSWTVEVSDGTNTDTATLNITVDAASSVAKTLFSDNFESGNLNAWTVSGNAMANAISSFGDSYGVRIMKTTYIQRIVSTIGYTNITLAYARQALSLSDGENLRVRWKVEGTSTWYDLETLNTTAYATHSKVLPAAAENTSIMIRFVTNANEDHERAYIDDIVVTGE